MASNKVINIYQSYGSEDVPRIGIDDYSFTSSNLTLSDQEATRATDDPATADFMHHVKSLPAFVYFELPLLVFPIGLVANTILLAYLIQSGRYKSPTFTIITSLCMCDWGSCLSTIARVLCLFSTMRYTNADYLCKLILYILLITFQGSMYHLAAFAIIRYFMLIYPLAARVYVTTGFVGKVCLGIWIVTSSYNIPVALFFGERITMYQGHEIAMCYFYGSAEIRELTLGNMNGLVPMVVVFICHVLKHKQVNRKVDGTVQERGSTDSRAVAVVILVVFATFSPQYIHLMLHHAFAYSIQPLHHIVWVVCGYNIVISSVINPFIYCFVSPTIRRDILHVLCNKYIGVK